MFAQEELEKEKERLERERERQVIGLTIVCSTFQILALTLTTRVTSLAGAARPPWISRRRGTPDPTRNSEPPRCFVYL